MQNQVVPSQTSTINKRQKAWTRDIIRLNFSFDKLKALNLNMTICNHRDRPQCDTFKQSRKYRRMAIKEKKMKFQYQEDFTSFIRILEIDFDNEKTNSLGVLRHDIESVVLSCLDFTDTCWRVKLLDDPTVTKEHVVFPLPILLTLLTGLRKKTNVTKGRISACLVKQLPSFLREYVIEQFQSKSQKEDRTGEQVKQEGKQQDVEIYHDHMLKLQSELEKERQKVNTMHHLWQSVKDTDLLQVVMELGEQKGNPIFLCSPKHRPVIVRLLEACNESVMKYLKLCSCMEVRRAVELDMKDVLTKACYSDQLKVSMHFEESTGISSAIFLMLRVIMQVNSLRCHSHERRYEHPSHAPLPLVMHLMQRILNLSEERSIFLDMSPFKGLFRNTMKMLDMMNVDFDSLETKYRFCQIGSSPENRSHNGTTEKKRNVSVAFRDGGDMKEECLDQNSPKKMKNTHKNDL